MSEDDAKKIARELLDGKKAHYDRCKGATQTKKDERDVWVVFFSRKVPEGVLPMLPETITVIVDDLTGKAEVFRSL